MALFGLTPPKKPAPPADSASSGPIFDVSTADFQTRVMKASLETPVLVDFWAPWCGPCKQLMPVLEAEVRAANGAVLLAKVNIDENPDLAQALRIQSVPTVMAFFQGQPVTGFTGARPASDIKKLIAELIKLSRSAMPGALDIPQALAEADAALAAGDFALAHARYLDVVTQDEANIEAYNGLVRVLIESGNVEEAEQLASGVPETVSRHPGFAAARTALDLAHAAKAAPRKLKPLIEKVQSAPDDHQARFDLATAQFAGGDKAGAIDSLIEIVRRDRAWNDEAARKELLRYFEALGFADPLAVQGRKKLSSLLFS